MGSRPRPHRHLVAPSIRDAPIDPGPGGPGLSWTRAARPSKFGRHHRLRPGVLGDEPDPAIEAVRMPFDFEGRDWAGVEDDLGGEFHAEWDGACLRVQVRFDGPRDLYGGGQVADGLRRNGRNVVFWNTDAYGYGTETPSLYQSHPLVWFLDSMGSTRILLANTIRRGQLSCHGDGFEFSFEGEPFDLHLLVADSPTAATGLLGEALGPWPLPPRWALGYHQCRYSYRSEREVRELVERFHAEGLPLDAVWLDIEAMDCFRDFTFDPDRFPDPKGLADWCAERGVKLVTILDPGLAAESDSGEGVPGETTAEEARAGGQLLLGSDGSPVRGRVWPGTCVFPDFTLETTRAWWAERVRRFVLGTGMAGLWNDMNEPAVFRSPTGTLPGDAVHRGRGGGSHRRFHNIYGEEMVRATRAGLVEARPGERPFVLTRAGHLGTGRLAATWTGDNQARWEDLAWAVPMVLSLSLCGQPFVGPDLGGFTGDPDPELFQRWFELGAYLPFARGHGEKGTCRKEPWSFGAEVLDGVRSSLRRRLALLPTLESLTVECAQTGVPMVRPLWFADPADPGLRDVDDAFLLGSDLLVAPVLERGQVQRRVRLPANPGGWFRRDGLPGAPRPRLESGSHGIDAPLGAAPVFGRGGSIVFELEALERTRDFGVARPQWNLFLDGSGQAEGSRYLPLGESPDPPWIHQRIRAALHGGTLELETVDVEQGPGAGGRSQGSRVAPAVLWVHGAQGHAAPMRVEDPGGPRRTVSLPE